MLKCRKEIQIEWRLDDPPIEPRRWHTFSKTDILAKQTALLAALDQRLGWPDSSTACLLAGFQANLQRSTGWQIEGGRLDNAVATAARQFKRGVTHRTSTETSLAHLRSANA